MAGWAITTPSKNPRTFTPGNQPDSARAKNPREERSRSMNTSTPTPLIQNMATCIHGKELTEHCPECSPKDEPPPKRKRVWKTPPPSKNPKKAHIGTRGRGRKRLTPPKNQETYDAFQAILNRKKPKPPASLRQWAIAAGIPYLTVLAWSRGENVPPAHMAIRLARAGQTTVEALFSHLANNK